MIYDLVIREMMDRPEPPKKQIGFTAKERRAKYLVNKKVTSKKEVKR